MARNKCSEAGCESRCVARGLCSLHYQRYRYRGALDEIAPAPEGKCCAHCGEQFQAALRRWGALYCSKRCNDGARRTRQQAAKGRRAETCGQCGASLEGRRPQARFCSDVCGQASRNARIAESVLAGKLASGRACAGCTAPIPAVRRGNALYCSDACKISSRRHENYGLSKQELGVLLAQHEVCAVCQTNDWGKKGPQVDHCHATGRVRGVLCINCNNGLGRFEDDPERLRRAASYLEG